MQIVQIIGALLILIPFTAVQFGWMRPTSRAYLVLNLVGSGVLTWLALDDSQWGFFLLEVVWAAVSLWGLIAVLRGRPVAAAAH
jgi:hypothetical protein